MKVTFVINTLKIGGAAKMIKYVANLAVDEFNEVSIIDMYDDNYKEIDLHAKIKVTCLGLGSVDRLKRQFLLVPKLRESIKQEKPDYVCSFIGHVNVIARLATINLKKIVFISAERGDPYTEKFLWKKLTSWTYRKSDFCFFQLEKARDFYCKEVKEKSYVIPNPYVSKDSIPPFRGERNKTIVSAGRFSPEKCYDILIAAFAKVLKLYPNYKLVLYGEGPSLDKYKEMAIKLNILDKIEFPGYVKSVPKSIYKDGLFVLSSLSEGIPNSLIEAMSVGIPCIATNCTPGGPDFLMKSGERGVLVPVNDVDSMANSICKLIGDKQLADYYGTKALDVIKELDESRISLMWKSAFKDIQNKSK